MQESSTILLVVPSYNPDKRLIELIDKLKNQYITDIVIIDDGSNNQSSLIFKEAEEQYGCVVLHHAVNLGKGRALKTAFNYFLTNYPDAVGVVTLDADGQHDADDVLSCMKRLYAKPDYLILGSRQFDTSMSMQNRLKNKLSYKMLQLMCGISSSDIQSGLRGIPAEFVRHLMNVPGERFDFELNMLVETKQLNISIEEIPIKSIESNDCGASFNPLFSSFYLYKKFFKFAFTSIFCFVIDIGLFSLFALLFKHIHLSEFILWATVFARILSSVTNYFINRHFVFINHTFKNMQSKESFVKFYIVEAVQMLLSAALVSIIFSWIGAFETVIKIIVDAILFIVNFPVQQHWVFSTKMRKR